jgi:hypothetical protein
LRLVVHLQAVQAVNLGVSATPFQWFHSTSRWKWNKTRHNLNSIGLADYFGLYLRGSISLAYNRVEFKKGVIPLCLVFEVVNKSLTVQSTLQKVLPCCNLQLRTCLSNRQCVCLISSLNLVLTKTIYSRCLAHENYFWGKW